MEIGNGEYLRDTSNVNIKSFKANNRLTIETNNGKVINIIRVFS